MNYNDFPLSTFKMYKLTSILLFPIFAYITLILENKWKIKDCFAPITEC